MARIIYDVPFSCLLRGTKAGIEQFLGFNPKDSTFDINVLVGRLKTGFTDLLGGIAHIVPPKSFAPDDIAVFVLKLLQLDWNWLKGIIVSALPDKLKSLAGLIENLATSDAAELKAEFSYAQPFIDLLFDDKTGMLALQDLPKTLWDKYAKTDLQGLPGVLVGILTDWLQ
jgi:hypothetical protein